MELIKLFEAIYNLNFLYHTCSIPALRYILRNNTIESRYSYNDSGDTTNCICVSRSKKFNIRTTKEDPISAQIVLKKEKIKSKYKVIPFTDNNRRHMEKDGEVWNQTAYEERIMTSKIPTVSAFIEEINIFILKDSIDDEPVKNKIKWIKSQSKKFDFPFNFYTYRLSDLKNGAENMYDMFDIAHVSNI